MPEYVEPAVRDLCEQESGEMVDLLLGVSGDRRELARDLQRLDPQIESPERIGRASLRASVPVESIDRICELDGAKSIELDARDVETHASSGDDQGNS